MCLDSLIFRLETGIRITGGQGVRWFKRWEPLVTLSGCIGTKWATIADHLHEENREIAGFVPCPAAGSPASRGTCEKESSMKYAMLATGLALAVACSGMAVAQTEVTRTTTTTTTLSPEERTTVREYITRDTRPSVRVEHF